MQSFNPIDPHTEIKRLKARIQELETKLKATEEERDKFKKKFRRLEKERD